MVKILSKIFILLFIFICPTQISRAQGVAPDAAPVKILLVPGHDNEVWGAQYGNVKEAAMNLAVASRIYNILKKDKRFEVHITRDTSGPARTTDGVQSGGYTKEFADYFSLHEDEITAFRENAKAEMQNRVESGAYVEKEGVPHNSVSVDVAMRLYGFNKWANENKIDAMIHIHFNDYPRWSKWAIGKYTGFVIYFPDGQMRNSFESGRLGANILMELEKKYTTSTYKRELGGLVTDQKLIALGSNGTLEGGVRSVLIEYGYIYEKRFRNYTTRHQAYDDMAKRTAEGISNYFFAN